MTGPGTRYPASVGSEVVCSETCGGEGVMFVEVGGLSVRAGAASDCGVPTTVGCSETCCES